MTLTLPDDPALAEFHESDLLLELACSLYAGSRLSRNAAARLAGLDRQAFDEELYRRQISSYTDEMLKEDLRTLESLHSK
ncbi:UPF0175 family protein [Prosthecobacter sp. SYSU 5D2]|uniref:UPF0175 family protein n=1 Tax=Prosthecobacter sp. SYSU 5D2 TaxID=3134134 RepID=UPI0031FEB393